jgi:hypothetical protein
MLNKDELAGLMPPDQFNLFFDDLVDTVLDARVNPGTQNKTIQGIMEQHGVTFDGVKTSLVASVQLSVSANIYGPTVEQRNVCPICTLCAACVLCGEANGLAGLVALTGIVSIA